MQNVNIVFNANANFSDLVAEVRRVNSELGALNTQMMGLDAKGRTSILKFNKSFAETLKLSGQFDTSIITASSNVETFGKNLDSGRLRLKDYYRTWRTSASSAQSEVKKLAEQQVRLERSIVKQTGIDAQGRPLMSVFTPRGLDLGNQEVVSAVNKKQVQIFNEMIKKGSTELINWGKNTQWAGRQLTVGLTVPMTIFAGTAATAFKKADEQLVRLAKVYGDVGGATQQQIALIKSQAMDLGKALAADLGAPLEQTLSLAADLAATGKTGDELIKATAETTRLAVLGEVDRQEAMSATLSIQTAFKQNTEELSDSINFLNAVENQTSTSLQDLVTAIPKAGPVVKSLGGDIKDLALYITAMREGGINASESANALKSGLASLINPTKQSVDVMSKFGIDILGMVSSNAGNTTELLLDLQSALDQLDPLSRAQAIEQLFGKFQFARISALLNNLGKEGSQTLQVFELMKASTSELATVASRELELLTESASGRFNRQIQRLKANFADIGEGFIPAFTVALDLINRLLEGFNSLPGPIKNVLNALGGIVALAGPVIMLAGVFGNFFGYLLKGLGFVRRFITGTKGFSLVTTETIAMQNAADRATTALYNEATAMGVLRSASNALTAQLAKLVSVQNTMAAGSVVGPRAVVNPRRYNTGVFKVPGSGNRDTVPAMLTPGESVIPKDMTQQYGPLINAMIKGEIPGYQTGLEAIISGYIDQDIIAKPTNRTMQALQRKYDADPAGLEKMLGQFIQSQLKLNQSQTGLNEKIKVTVGAMEKSVKSRSTQRAHLSETVRYDSLTDPNEKEMFRRNLASSLRIPEADIDRYLPYFGGLSNLVTGVSSSANQRLRGSGSITGSEFAQEIRPDAFFRSAFLGGVDVNSVENQRELVNLAGRFKKELSDLGNVNINDSRVAQMISRLIAETEQLGGAATIAAKGLQNATQQINSFRVTKPRGYTGTNSDFLESLRNDPNFVVRPDGNIVLSGYENQVVGRSRSSKGGNPQSGKVTSTISTGRYYGSDIAIPRMLPQIEVIGQQLGFKAVDSLADATADGVGAASPAVRFVKIADDVATGAAIGFMQGLESLSPQAKAAGQRLTKLVQNAMVPPGTIVPNIGKSPIILGSGAMPPMDPNFEQAIDTHSDVLHDNNRMLNQLNNTQEDTLEVDRRLAAQAKDENRAKFGRRMMGANILGMGAMTAGMFTNNPLLGYGSMAAMTAVDIAYMASMMKDMNKESGKAVGLIGRLGTLFKGLSTFAKVGFVGLITAVATAFFELGRALFTANKISKSFTDNLFNNEKILGASENSLSNYADQLRSINKELTKSQEELKAFREAVREDEGFKKLVGAIKQQSFPARMLGIGLSDEEIVQRLSYEYNLMIATDYKTEDAKEIIAMALKDINRTDLIVDIDFNATKESQAIKKIFAGLENQLLNATGGLFTQFSDTFTDYVFSIRGLVELLGTPGFSLPGEQSVLDKIFGPKVTKQQEKQNQVLSEFANMLSDVLSDFTQMYITGTSIDEILKQINQSFKGIDPANLELGLEAVKEQILTSNEASLEQDTILKDLIKNAEDYKELWKITTLNIAGVNSALIEGAKNSGNLNKLLSLTQSIPGKLSGIFKDYIKSNRQIEKSAENQQKAIDSQIKSLQDRIKLLREQERVENNINKLKALQLNHEKAMQDMSVSLSDALAGGDLSAAASILSEMSSAEEEYRTEYAKTKKEIQRDDEISKLEKQIDLLQEQKQSINDNANATQKASAKNKEWASVLTGALEKGLEKTGNLITSTSELNTLLGDKGVDALKKLSAASGIEYETIANNMRKIFNEIQEGFIESAYPKVADDLIPLLDQLRTARKELKEAGTPTTAGQASRKDSLKTEVENLYSRIQGLTKDTREEINALLAGNLPLNIELSPKNMTVNAENVVVSANRPGVRPSSQTFKDGGYVTGPGTGTSDSIPARLSAGEYVIKASSVKKYGKDALDAMNFGGGGMIPGYPMGGLVSYKDGGEAKDGWLQKYAKSLTGLPLSEMTGTAPLLRLLAGMGGKGDKLSAATLPLAFTGLGIGSKIANDGIMKSLFAIPNKIYQMRNQAKVNQMIKRGMYHGSAPKGHQGEEYLRGTNVLDSSQITRDPYFGMGFFGTSSKMEADLYASGYNTSTRGDAFGAINKIMAAPKGNYVDFTKKSSSIKWQDYGLSQALGIKKKNPLGQYLQENLGGAMSQQGMTGAIMNRINAGFTGSKDIENAKWLAFNNPSGVVTTSKYKDGGLLENPGMEDILSQFKSREGKGSPKDLLNAAMMFFPYGRLAKFMNPMFKGIKNAYKQTRAIHRSEADSLTGLSDSLFSARSGFKNFGPGTYFASNRSQSRKYYSDFGQNQYKITTTNLKAKIQALLSKGYITDDILESIKDELISKGLPTNFSDPSGFIKLGSYLRDKGYLGYSPAKDPSQFTNWMIGTPGWGLKSVRSGVVDKLQPVKNIISSKIKSFQYKRQIEQQRANWRPGVKMGGYIKGYGMGGPTDDSVLARISNGEYIMSANTVKKMGVGFMDRLNSGSLNLPQYAMGGYAKFGGGGYAMKYADGGTVNPSSNNVTYSVSMNINNPGASAQEIWSVFESKMEQEKRRMGKNKKVVY